MQGAESPNFFFYTMIRGTEARAMKTVYVNLWHHVENVTSQTGFSNINDASAAYSREHGEPYIGTCQITEIEVQHVHIYQIINENQEQRKMHCRNLRLSC